MEGRVPDISKPLYITGMDISLVKGSKPIQNKKIGWETGKNAKSERLTKERKEAKKKQQMENPSYQ